MKPLPSVALAIPNGSRAQSMRIVATGLLVVMALLFVASSALQHRHPAVAFVRAFAEAAMVGGLADWFAVTALFRHPLRLPIPHTAIIPNKKDQIGEGLASFVQQYFLTSEVLSERLAAARVPELV